jgi:ribonuclease HI
MAEQLQIKQHWLRNVKAHKTAKQKGKTWTDLKWGVIDLQIHWTPSHVDFPPNEHADELAKLAAQGTSSPQNLLPVFLCNKPLPASIAATRQEHLTTI